MIEKYWTENDYSDLAKAQSFDALSKIAMRILERMYRIVRPNPIIQVCGPISSGGAGSRVLNLHIFQGAIERLVFEGIEVFNQMPFENDLFRITRTQIATEGITLLEKFYLPIFRSGIIKELYFLHDWESSFGANWEYARAMELNIPVVILPFYYSCHAFKE